MAYKFEGLPNLATLDQDWGKSRDSVRLSLFRIERALHQLYSGKNPLGSGDPTPQNIGGIGGGGTVSINQVDENDLISGSTEGILVFGRGETDSLAHAIRVNSSGEILVAELPGTTLAASFSQSQAFPDFVTMIGTIPYGKRELAGVDNSNMGRLGAGQYAQFNIGQSASEDETDGDNGLLTMPSPKVHAQVFNEFNGGYYVGGAGQNVSLSSGTHNAGSQLGVWRFRRGIFHFSTGVTGSPPGTIQIRLYGQTSAAGTSFVLKVWEFDTDSFIDGTFNTQVLRFDVETPFLSWQVFATAGADVSNRYDIANFSASFQS